MATREDAGHRFRDPPLPTARRLWRLLCGAIRRHEQRRALSGMERWQLDDLGLSREDADREARRRPWDGVAQG